MIESLSKVSDWSSSLSNIASCSLWSLFKKEEVLIETAPSLYRKVFQTTPEMKKEFSLFLQTIFYQLDEAVLKKLAERLQDFQIRKNHTKILN